MVFERPAQRGKRGYDATSRPRATVEGRSHARLQHHETGVIFCEICLLKNIVANIRCVLFTFQVVHAKNRRRITHEMVLTPPYMAGMNQFIQFTLAHNNGAKDILCTCKDCDNGVT